MGLLIPPTGVGTYTVLATVDDPNYAGKASGTLTVTPAGTKYSLEILLNNADGGSVINSTAQTACGGTELHLTAFPIDISTEGRPS